MMLVKMSDLPPTHTSSGEHKMSVQNVMANHSIHHFLSPDHCWGANHLTDIAAQLAGLTECKEVRKKHVSTCLHVYGKGEEMLRRSVPILLKWG